MPRLKFKSISWETRKIKKVLVTIGDFNNYRTLNYVSVRNGYKAGLGLKAQFDQLPQARPQDKSA